MTHTGTYDFAPHTALIDSDDQVFATVDEFRHECRCGQWDRTVAFFWAVTLGVTIGTTSWWGLVGAA